MKRKQRSPRVVLRAVGSGVLAAVRGGGTAVGNPGNLSVARTQDLVTGVSKRREFTGYQNGDDPLT